MSDNESLQSLFHSIDHKDRTAYKQFLAPDCSFRLGNLPVATGRKPSGLPSPDFSLR